MYVHIKKKGPMVYDYLYSARQAMSIRYIHSLMDKKVLENNFLYINSNTDSFKLVDRSTHVDPTLL
jgi:hypothetical protein